MSLSLFSSAGLEMIFVWIHFLAGITWIGMLYFFNFVQVPYMAEADAVSKPSYMTKLLPRGLWWFRWGALFTLISGLCIVGVWMGQFHGAMRPHKPIGSRRMIVSSMRVSKL